MGWDERLFHWGIRALKRPPAESPHRVLLGPILSSLEILVSAIVGRPIRIAAVASGPGYTRRNSICLPSQFDLFSDRALNLLLYRVRVGCAAIVLRHQDQGTSPIPWLEALTRTIREDFPGLKRDLEALDAARPSHLSEQEWVKFSRGNLPEEDLSEGEGDHLLPIDRRDPATPFQQDSRALPPRAAKRRELDPKNPNPLVHVFEKLLTAEDFSGTRRATDADDASAASPEALAELDLDQVIRAEGSASNHYEAASVLDELAAARAKSAARETTRAEIFTYPEWSFRRRRLIPDWCTLRESCPPTPSLVEPRSTPPIVFHEAELLSDGLEKIASHPRWQRRQNDGEELDLDAITRWRSECLARSSGDARLWEALRPADQELAVLVLGDRSLSSEAWIGKLQVIELLKQCQETLLLGLAKTPIAYSIASFFSHTRNQCSFEWIKNFEEKSPAHLREASLRIAEQKPVGYTRIGPALRHATQALTRTRARRKLILLFSDAKPTDYDAYEGPHGESDVAHAILEARHQSVDFQAVALSSQMAAHYTRMYGARAFFLQPELRGLALNLLPVFAAAIRRHES